jgi:hypothetical protein
MTAERTYPTTGQEPDESHDTNQIAADDATLTGEVASVSYGLSTDSATIRVEPRTADDQEPHVAVLVTLDADSEAWSVLFRLRPADARQAGQQFLTAASDTETRDTDETLVPAVSVSLVGSSDPATVDHCVDGGQFGCLYSRLHDRASLVGDWKHRGSLGGDLDWSDCEQLGDRLLTVAGEVEP